MPNGHMTHPRSSPCHAAIRSYTRTMRHLVAIGAIAEKEVIQ